MNSLLYKAKKLNTAYERLIEVKVYNYLRHLKRKLLQKLKKSTDIGLNVKANNVSRDLTESCKKTEENLASEKTIKEIEREAEYSKLLKKAELIPDSNGQRYYEKLDIRIGIICEDVYKRQVLCGASGSFCSRAVKRRRSGHFRIHGASNNHENDDRYSGTGKRYCKRSVLYSPLPVSYTHLDVYKRQVHSHINQYNEASRF